MRPAQEPGANNIAENVKIGKLNQMNSSLENDSDHENPLLSHSYSKADSANQREGSPEMVHTHRMQNDESIRKSRLSPVLLGVTRNQVI